MRQRPLFFNFLKMLHLVLIFWIPIQVMITNDMNLTDIYFIPKHLNTINIILIILFAASFYSLNKLDRYTPIFLIFSLVAVVFNNQFAQINNQYRSWIFNASSLAYFFILLPAFWGNNFRAMVDKKNQWWKNQSRKKAMLKVRVFDNGIVHEFESFDISKSGIFVSNLYDTVQKGKDLTIEVEFQDNIKSFCLAEVIRICNPKGDYPSGAGLIFTTKTEQFNQALGKFLKDVNEPFLSS